MAKKQASKSTRFMVEVDPETYRWLAQISVDAGTTTRKIAASIIHDVRVDDEACHQQS